MLEILYEPKNILVQGMTGKHGSFHTEAMLAAGSSVVAGVTPGKGGSLVHGVPVYDTVLEATKKHKLHVSAIFVPAPFFKQAALEAIAAGMTFIIGITEGVPVHDMLEVRSAAIQKSVTFIGPNCPGVLVPGVNKLGIIPADVALPCNAAIVSRSGTLTYEVASSLSDVGIGQKIIVGIGGDRISGTDFVDCLTSFYDDPLIDKIILIGEIGGESEYEAAKLISRQHDERPVFAYIAGHSAPANQQLGHAGAILGSQSEAAAAKTAALEKAGAIVADDLVTLVKKIVTYTA